MKNIRFTFWGIILLSLGFLAQCAHDEHDSEGPDTDGFVGEHKVFQLSEQLQGFFEKDLVCHILAPDGSVITRECVHQRENSLSLITMDKGLREGVYRLLFFEYDEDRTFGLGMRIEFSKGTFKVLDTYDPLSGLSGQGTPEDPYIVTAAEHLSRIRKFTNSYPTEGVYFRQEADIEAKYMKKEVELCDPVHFWTPIGYDNNNPFSGVYDGNHHYIEYVKAIADGLSNGVALGLFGYLGGATIQNLTVQHSYVKGVYGVGVLAGIAISKGGTPDTTHLINCQVYSSEAYSFEDGASVGAVLGAVDAGTILNIAECRSRESEVSADYNAGGIIGAGGQRSSILINLCENSSSVKVNKGSAGGIIAVGDTVNIVGSKNLKEAVVEGPITDIDQTQRSFGGIIGGARAGWITACQNQGTVKGYEGTGGIIGSTRSYYSEETGYVFNNVYLRYCKNSGSVSGERNIGGLCGEAQLACYGCINEGKVSGKDFVGGFAGNTAYAAIHNSVNNGEVEASGDYVAGIVANTCMGIIADVQNLGEVTGSGSHAAGIVGYAVNNSLIHYSANYGEIHGANSPVGGIVAEMGMKEELSPLNKAEIAFGVIQIVAGVIVGPTLAIAHHALNGVASAVVLVIEVAVDVIVDATEIAFISVSGYHANNPHVHAIASRIVETVEKDLNEMNAELKALREKQTFSLASGLALTNLKDEYPRAVDSLTNYLQLEEQVRMFNDSLNLAMHERAEQVNELNEKHETSYQIAAGLILATEVVAMVGLAIVSEGSLAPVLAGLFCSTVGGMNSIVKGLTDYQDNIVMVTQCVNFGEISGGSADEVGGIVGRFQKRGYLSHCLNAGNGPGYGGELVGYLDDEYTVLHSIGLADMNSWSGVYGDSSYEEEYDTREGIYYFKNQSNIFSYYHATGLTSEQLPLPSSYKEWSIGADQPWRIPEVPTGSTGVSYPIPNNSIYW